MLTRRGFTITELIVAMVLLGLIMTTLTTVVIQQQRFYAGTSEVIETRSNVRQVADILPSEFRGLSPANGDIYAMTSSSIEYRASIGSSAICTILVGRTKITLPPLTTTAQNGSSAWLTPPEIGDSLLVYDTGPTPATADDAWRAYELASAPYAGTCTRFTANPAEAATGYTVDLTGALAVDIQDGASIRFFRRSRYELYNGPDGQGYLGFSDCLASRATPCSTRQPVSGPYLPLGGNPEGLTFSYFDQNNAVTAIPAEVSRIDAVIRSRTRGNVRIAGYKTGRYTDSLTFSIAARN